MTNFPSPEYLTVLLIPLLINKIKKIIITKIDIPKTISRTYSLSITPSTYGFTLGNIIKVTDVFNNFKPKKRKEILPTGFIVGLKNIYLSTNIGRLLVIDIKSGKTISTLKIDKDKISRPFVSNQNLYLAKDNAIIKLN